MSGMHIPVIKKRTIDHTNLPQASTVYELLSDPIYVGDYSQLVLLVRVHDKNIGNGGSLQIAVLNELPCPEDPSQYFIQAWGASPLASVTVDTTTPAVSPVPPSAGVALGVGSSGSTQFGSHVRVLVKATGPVAGNLYANLSVALQLKL